MKKKNETRKVKHISKRILTIEMREREIETVAVVFEPNEDGQGNGR